MDPGLGDGPAGDLVGATRQVIDRCWRTGLWRFVICAATRIAASSVNNVLLLAEERDRRPGGTSAIRCVLRAPAVGREYRFMDMPQLCFSVTLRDLIEREGEGS